ncbi:MAG: hypothetical protein KDC99_04120, partial [Cyclobacteriaceae bacterium]|nr:hypothetical protein [Cyclobacteriaceae bacterium]
VGIDTDQFGTFSGEIPRHKSIIDTARAKCDFVFLKSGCDLVLASEGTFGPHPASPLIPSDHEFLLLKDFVHDLEITGAVLSYRTNYHQKTISDFEELMDFATSVKFPSHGIILRSCAGDLIYKGINEGRLLRKCFDEMMRSSKSILAETDMRANFNPTRTDVIKEAASDLVKNAFSMCAKCSAPGFSIQKTEAGLPCQLCGNPTRSALKNVFECKKCGHQLEICFPNHKKVEDPMYCDYCNP